MGLNDEVSRTSPAPTPPSPGPAAYAGVDIGTQGVRVTLVDEAGTPVAQGAAPLQSERGAGRRHEQDAEDWWTATVAACSQATAAADARGVRALAVCSTSGTIVLTDRAGRPLAPALMYDDPRGAEHVDRVAATGADVWERNAVRVQSSWALPKILWLLDHDPRARDGLFLHSADFVLARLAGTLTPTDASHALKTGYDVVSGRWPEDMLGQLGLSSAQLPRVVHPGRPVGTLGAAAAEATGLPEGATLVAGMTDGCAGQIAAGALAPGQGVSVLGTTLVLKAVSEELLRDPHGAVYSHRHPDGGWLPGGASNVGAAALDAAFPRSELPRLDDRAAAFEPAGAVVYPLTARGERFPFYRPDAEAFTVGSVSSTEERYAAILQGIAFVERLGLAALALLGAPVTGPLALTGGATRSRYWSQLRADVLGRPVELPRHPEASVGMAILAAMDGDTLQATAARMVPAGERIDPRPDRVARFDEAFARLVEALSERGYVAPELAAGALATA